jgi:CRP-like cAMP-binding protein
MDATDVARLLGRTEPCLGMGPDQLADIAKAGEIRVSFEGDELTREGTPGVSMLLLLDGTAEVLKRGTDGGMRRIAEVCGGALLGEMALLESARRTATVRATSAVRLFEIQKGTFDRLLDLGDRSATRLLLGIARVLVRRQRITNERLTNLLAANAERKVTPPEIDDFLRDIVIDVEM